MFKTYLLKKGFWSCKNNPNRFLRHDRNAGGIYARIIFNDENQKGLELTVEDKKHFFSNFDELEEFFYKLQQKSSRFITILKRTSMGKQLRKLFHERENTIFTEE